ncbi:MAG TPA: hypothetical protein VMV47_18690 [Bacteroidales bacterium]|nr:hypothetical protein [Bacteroidales bacterium]
MNLRHTTDFSDKKTLEKLSSAFTLSDMEIFIFPELFYPLVLANIMSPEIWKWRDDPWFKDIEKKSFNNKVNRIKQYIIQNYVFNLDLSTWGLTTKDKEIARFSDFFDIELLKKSNALFGYEGDKYYFDIDIRKHFGLDKFNSDIIPYWKTETIEAMTAFKYKEGFSSGAGECVSLSALYAAAMFIMGRIPLEKIFLIATPLHSQNFLTEKDGLITNNRRIVTKNMWFNGTSLSEKARRAMENEKVTIVSHITGHIHQLYDEASINKRAYKLFCNKLKEFLTSDLSCLIFINFLRFKSKYKSLFQFRCDCSGSDRFISLEKMFEYEHTSKYNVSAESRQSLVKEIEGDEFHMSPIQGKLFLNDVEDIIENLKGKSIEEVKDEVINFSGPEFRKVLEELFSDLKEFILINPKLPDPDKKYSDNFILCISPADSRELIIEKLSGSIDRSEMALLSLYVYRDMEKIDWKPFIKAAIERNPVCFNDLAGKSTNDIYDLLNKLPDESIYEMNRLALPDEVWNFRRGDGIEKALLLADVILNAEKNASIKISVNKNKVILEANGKTYYFRSAKKFSKTITVTNGEINVS